MYTNNPYAQGGWYNPANPETINLERTANTNNVQPSLFGALPHPYPDMNKPAQHLLFHFTYSNASILNCTIYGPSSRKYVDVVTNLNKLPHVTVFSKFDGEALAVIEWQQKPIVKITGVLPQQYIASWIPISQDQSFRTMDSKGLRYIWSPVGDAIHLHQYHLPPSQEVLKIQRQSGTVTLDITTEAIQAGLLEMAIVATVVLQSGRNVD